MPWPERVLETLHLAGMSQDAYEPLEWKFDSRAQAGIMRHRSQARPLPNEVYGGPPSLVIGFHWTDDSDLLPILQTNYGQLKPGPASFGGNYVYVRGLLGIWVWKRGC